MNENYSPEAKIRNLYIELDDYEFFHTPFDSNMEMERRFVGRKKIKSRIKNLLRNSISESGTYLITGFRGMGKTSVLRESIADLNKRKEKLKETKSRFRKRTLVGTAKRMIWVLGVFSSCYWIGLFGQPNLLSEHKLGYLAIVLSVLFVALLVELVNTIFIKVNSKTQEKSIWERPNRIVIWGFVKIFTFLLLYILVVVYLLLPNEFCNNSKFGFECVESNFIYLLASKIAKKSFYISIIAGSLLTYVFISLILFAHDVLYRTVYTNRWRGDYKDNKNNKLEHYTKFEINLSQETISDREVLKRINDKVLEFWKENEVILNIHQFQRSIYKPWLYVLNFVSTGKSNRKSDYFIVKKKLQALKLRLSGAVSQSEELGTDPNLATTFVKGATELTVPVGKITDRNTVSYNLASAKEAEDELINIFSEIKILQQEIGVKTKFVFIIDELDKIEPQSSSLIDEKEFSNPAMDSGVNIPGSREYRKRQEAVAKLLSNLKGFLSLAKAKFFFIGGRELFDADLADIADRDSFYSSIFNDVIYVESFYRDKPKNNSKGGISSLTEAFLINIIYSKKKDKLSRLLDLIKYIYKFDDNNYYLLRDKNKVDLKFDESIFKMFALLQNYIIYLTYRGTGAPKKITSLVESLIVEKKLENINDSIIIHQERKNNNYSISKKKRLYLKFSYTVQYEINLTTDLLRPYLITNSRFLSNLGDKLLFSTPFIFDHIIKYYPYGFSWRNLELIPEVVLVNKEPYLRNHIKSILNYLLNYQIKFAVSGLYQYKFHSIIRKELSILTKRSDLAAAAFNFTLDESLLVKRHYKKKLIELRNKYQDYQPLEGNNKFVHSLSFVQTVLADLYFYDKEYDEAILYYTESIQALRLPNAIDDRYITRHQFLLWLRNTLKIGLTLEKIEAYDSAISLYRTLMIDSPRYLLNITNDPSENYVEEISVENEWGKVKQIFQKTIDNSADSISEDHRNMHLITLPFVAQLATIEKLRSDGITYANLTQNRLELSKVIEPKYDISIRDEKEFVDNYRKSWLWSDYYSNVGSILFFKNKHFPEVFKNSFDRIDIAPEIGSESKLDHINNILISQYDRIKSGVFNEFRIDYSPSLTSVRYYYESLTSILSQQSRDMNEKVNEEMGIAKVLDSVQLSSLYLLPKYMNKISAKRFYYIANIISKIGDALLSSLSSQNIDNSNEDWIKDFTLFKKYSKKKIKNLSTHYREITNKLEFNASVFSHSYILRLFILASELYRRSGKNYYYAFAQKKVLLIVKELMPNKVKSNNIKRELHDLIEALCLEVIRTSSWYNSISNTAQIKKYRDIFNIGGLSDNLKDNSILYNGISNNNDALEALLITESIKSKINGNYTLGSVKLKSTDMAKPKYIRLLQLKLHLEEQYRTVKFILSSLDNPITFNEYKSGCYSISDHHINESIKVAMIESFFAVRESIKIIQMYSPGYIIGYSYLATAHMWAGDWCQIYENHFRYIINSSTDTKKKDFDLNKLLEELLSQNSMYFLESNYQYETAIQNYYNVLQMHSEGVLYKTELSDIYVLEDDYNDSLTHFNLAFERYQINTGVIRERISLLSGIVDNSKIYDYENYSGISYGNRIK